MKALEIIIKGTTKDFPLILMQGTRQEREAFKEAVKASVRRRLELKAEDTVTIEIIGLGLSE